MKIEYSVFVSSPSDVSSEREIVAEVIDEINQTHGEPLGYRLKVWKYEDQAYPSAQKPQELINEILTPYQIFIGIMWKRFGTPTPNANSGTEEEYNLAYEAWQKKEVNEIMFYFSTKPFSYSQPEEVNQLMKVVEFKKKLEGTSFIWTYEDKKDFEKKIRKHLCNYMNRKVEESKKGLSRAAPEKEVIEDFKKTWNLMDPQLQNYLNISYNENRMKGDPGIQTRDLFAAMVSQPTPELSAIMRNIPQTGLPSEFKGELVNEPYLVDEQPWLSHCISSSVKRLSKAVPEGRKITAVDIFVDIARNGTGASVQLLRDHQIDAKKIEEILKKEKLDAMIL